MLGDEPRYGREQKKHESHQSRRNADTHNPPSHQEEQAGQQEAGLMSGDGVQALASVGRGEELDFGHGERRVVPAQVPAASAFAHGVVASHGVPLPQRVLVRQLALLESLD